MFWQNSDIVVTWDSILWKSWYWENFWQIQHGIHFIQTLYKIAFLFSTPELSPFSFLNLAKYGDKDMAVCIPVIDNQSEVWKITYSWGTNRQLIDGQTLFWEWSKIQTFNASTVQAHELNNMFKMSVNQIRLKENTYGISTTKCTSYTLKICL